MTEYLTHAEVAALLRTTPNSLHALYARRRPYLPPRHKFGSRLLYKRSEVEASIKSVGH
jgi:hypothetical protein